MTYRQKTTSHWINRHGREQSVDSALAFTNVVITYIANTTSADCH